MANQKRALAARKPRDWSRDDESFLLRSAESLGRVIGSLQRQLDEATRRLSATASPKKTKASTKNTRELARTPNGSAVAKKTRKR